MIGIGSAVTTVSVQNTSAAQVSSAPVTFAQTFVPGDLPMSGANVLLRASDNSTVQCQFDAKAFNGDGSVRHAIISTIFPSLTASELKTFSLERAAAPSAPVPAVPADFTGLDSVVAITEGGTVYTVSLATLLAGPRLNWLAGDIVSEWGVAGIPKTAGGVEHAHLHVRFQARAYKGQGKARIDVTVENNWAWDAAPQDVTYDVAITVGGASVYTKAGLVHFHHARWRKLFWFGTTEPAVHVRHNTAYLIASKAVPNYDQSITPSAAAITPFANLIASKGEPMGSGCAVASMGSPGGRPDIGILPGWAALYLLDMSKPFKDVMMRQGDLAGSWHVHFRDKNTGRVLSLNDWPHFSTSGSSADNINPATGLSEKAPAASTAATTLAPDVSHHPQQGYLAYLVSGDVYYLEELQFWAMFCIISQNSAINRRDGKKGLLLDEQVRGMAWAIRSLAHAAYISPPGVQKDEFTFILQSNINYFDTRYTYSTSNEAKLGCMMGYGAIIYSNGLGIANWQDDFITASAGLLVELGHEFARPFFNWKAKWPTARLGTPGASWVQAAAYGIIVRPTNTAPNYTTYKECYDATMSPAVLAVVANGNIADQVMADAWRDHNAWRVTAPIPGNTIFMDGVSNPFIGDMDGYSDSTEGYPSNMQPAIAYCATHGVTNGVAGFAVFNGRSVKPNYSTSPQFAILPRSIETIEPNPVLPPSTYGELMTYDRVKTSTTTAGTGNITVSATAAARSRPLSDIPIGAAKVPLVIEDEAGTDWELSYCTILSPTTFSRDTVIKGSNYPSKTNFGSSSKSVYLVVDADHINGFLTATSLSALGTTLPNFLAANPATDVAPGDLTLITQGSNAVGVSTNSLATFVLSRYPVVRTTAVKILTVTPFPLDFTTHNRRRLVCSAATTINGPTSYSSVSDDFECEVINISGGTVTFGAGITCLPAGNTLANGGVARVFSCVGIIYAMLPTAAASGGTGTAPGQVTGLTVGSPTSTALTANYVAPATGTAPFSYTIQYRATGATVWATAATGVSTLTYQITGLAAATGYDVQVAATNTTGTGVYSTVSTGTTSAAAASGVAPSQVTGLTAGTATSTTQPLTWTAPATGTAPFTYKVEVSADSGTTWATAAAAVSGTAYTVTGRTAATSYSYRVSATNATSTGPVSAVVTASTAAAAATAPFTITTRADFPLTRATYSSNGVSNLWLIDVTATGVPTLSTLTFFLVDSNSVTPLDTTSSTSTPRGVMDTAPATYPGTGRGSNAMSLSYAIPTPVNYYLWLRIVDSAGATWWFRRPTAVQFSDTNATTTTTAAEAVPQV